MWSRNMIDICNFPPNLALIPLAVSETMSFIDGRATDGRKTDAPATTVALLCSSTKQS